MASRSEAVYRALIMMDRAECLNEILAGVGGDETARDAVWQWAAYAEIGELRNGVGAIRAKSRAVWNGLNEAGELVGFRDHGQ